MKVILFHIGDFPIGSYGVLVALAVMLGLGVAYYLAKGTIYRQHVLDMSLFVIIAAVIGARFWHVFFFQWGYYSENLHQIFAVWQGGLSILGALVGGGIALSIYTWYHKLNFLEFADILAPAVIFGQAVGRIACLLNGDAYGSPTGSNFGLVYPEGTMAYAQYGSQPLWPAEVWEGQWNLIVFGLLLILRNRTWPNGFIFLAYISLYSFGRFMLEFLRGDSPRYLFEWTAGQWTTMPMIVIALIGMGILFMKKENKQNLDNKAVINHKS